MGDRNVIYLSVNQFKRSPDYSAYGPAFGQMLALTACLSDDGRAACPPEWLELSSLLCGLIEDDGLTTEQAARAAAVPGWLVAGYRAQMGI